MILPLLGAKCRATYLSTFMILPMAIFLRWSRRSSAAPSSGSMGRSPWMRLNYGIFSAMAARKITITLPDDQVHEIRSLLATGEAANVSASVKHAVGVALSCAAGWREMLQVALQQTGGPLTKRKGPGRTRFLRLAHAYPFQPISSWRLIRQAALTLSRLMGRTPRLWGYCWDVPERRIS